MSIESGARLGPYELGPAIGAGGMGEVYRARDPRLGRDVAIKILPPEVADDPDRLRRFEQEAHAAAALNHPNILSVHDVGTDNGVAYLVTELLEGRTLREVMSPDVGRDLRISPEAELKPAPLYGPIAPSNTPNRSQTASPPRTHAASSIATSSPRTSSSPPMGA